MLVSNHVGDYSLYFEQPQGATWLTEPTVATVYLYITGECRRALFLPDRERIKAPPKLRIPLFERDYYASTPEGIFVSIPALSGISRAIDDMRSNGTWETNSAACPPPLGKWSDIRMSEIPISSAVEEYRTTLSEQYCNGSVLIKQFEISDQAQFDNAWKIQFPFGSPVFQCEVLKNPSLRTLPPIQTANFKSLAEADWHQSSSFLFGGMLAKALYGGGAYKSMAPDFEVCLKLAESARYSLWGNNYGSIYSYETFAPWSEWFYDVAWDSTLLTLDRANRKIVCLFTTDTD